MVFVDPTIFAVSSGRPPAGIAVIRISGPGSAAALRQLAGIVPAPRTATRVTLRDENAEPIDDALVLWFPGPRSATGEDVAELHVHGGRAVIAAVFAALGRVPGLRPAEPGEFTRRAFENGKLDLTAAEGLDDLIHADTERQRRQALRQLNGLLGDKALDWRKQIIACTALIEVGIDFSDEGDVPDDLRAPALEKIAALHREMTEVLAAQGQSERLRDGLMVVIAGAPNAGKSTLLNRLARREVAIVSPQPGTTRDVLEVHLDLDGYPVTMIDTAGIRNAGDPVEQEGVRRARARAAEADLVLWLVDSRAVPDEPETNAAAGAVVWTVRTKTDALPETLSEANRVAAPHAISAMTGAGMDALIGALLAFAATHFNDENALIARVRHRRLLEDASTALGRAGQGEAIELMAEDLRSAADSLGRLVGKIDVEDVLDSIFRDFCIGK